jgi:hypothetical protein
VCAHFDAQRLADDALERSRVPLGGPQLELGIAARTHLEERVLTAIVEVDGRDGLRVAAVEVFGQPQHGAQRADDLPPLAAKVAVPDMPALRRPASMIPGDECDGLDLVGFEPAEITVLDQVIGMLVVLLVTDVNAAVVKNRRVLKPLALAIGETVDATGAVEEKRRELGDVVRVVRPVAAAFGQFHDAAPPHVGIEIGLRDLLSVLGDVVEDQPLPQ